MGIRELRQHASRYVEAARRGETITVTDRGTPVARLVPLSPLENHLADVIAAHQLVPPQRSRRTYSNVRRAEGPPLSADVERDRDERVS